MSGMSRFLSRRDKNHKRNRSKPRNVSTDLYDIFIPEEVKKKTDKEEEKKIKAANARLTALGITHFKDEHIAYALRFNGTQGKSTGAVDLLILFQDSVEGIIREYDPKVILLGAENRGNVTCYLDALLFAMFARLDSFEAILFDNFPDEPRKRLAALLRLWVNLERTGRLIPVDIVKHIQEALSSCGWEDAEMLHQQDVSEAFTFITGTLELPLLTLKMDIYHTGKEDAADDHKFVNERLLEVAIPAEPSEGNDMIKLEDCLETYFNNKIEVKRYLARRNTMQHAGPVDKAKNSSIYVETVEVPMTPDSPSALTPIGTPISTHRPLTGRTRADSIFSQRHVLTDEKRSMDNVSIMSGRTRANSLRREVLMPAWQFFSLIPWYTDNAPTNDLQVAAHFTETRPMLGICLKRYSMLPDGTSKKNNAYIDIPLEIGLPHFISDEQMKEDGPIYGNFKLSLQSVVCHRGNSTNSGHYIALVRCPIAGTNHGPVADDSGRSPLSASNESWMRLDDLAKERVVYVNIYDAMKEESPYLLFYQVQPIDWDPDKQSTASADGTVDSISANPSKNDLASTTTSTATSKTDVTLVGTPESPTENPSSEMLIMIDQPSCDPSPVPDSKTCSGNNSIDFSRLSLDQQRNSRSSISAASGIDGDRRTSVTFDDQSLLSSVQNDPTTPAEETSPGLIPNSRRSSKSGPSGKKSRPASGETGHGFSIAKLGGMISRDRLTTGDTSTPEVHVSGVHSTDNKEKEKATGLGRSKSKKVKERLGGRSHGKEKEAHHHHHKAPDRECVLM
ncbi:cysteine proteinase [Patellaria atrata CBS 101060]|uniref:ubiquitinyl hydrolase 1 n=1 Tax=Patellaria atrata CBS 101060 TaxID=1346257 RepID=A0A9P4SEY2_9PEZI|nr:cysteine proteinase [Patellaria atrata CBS 101060]